MTCNCISSSTKAVKRPAAITSGSRSTTSTRPTTPSSARTSGEWGAELVELPSGQVQLYFHDPAGNLIELNWHDASQIDRTRYPMLNRLADRIPQTPESNKAVLYLERTS